MIQEIKRVLSKLGLYLLYSFLNKSEVEVSVRSVGNEEFFLEGDKFIGKSMLLRESLRNFGYSIGGFYVDRLKDETDEIVGFVLKDAKELFNPEKTDEIIKEHCFLRMDNGKRRRNLAVFEHFGKQLLRDASHSQSDIILLDEIGGIELLVPSFTAELMKLTAQPRKILGVFKSDKNYQRQRQNSQKKLDIAEQREKLRTQICLNNGEIIELTEENRTQCEKKVQDFLRQ